MSSNISKLPGSGPYGFQDNAYYEGGTLIMDGFMTALLPCC
jgi:hypothetical protein